MLKLFVNCFPHIIQFNHILCEMSCEKKRKKHVKAELTNCMEVLVMNWNFDYISKSLR